MTNDYEKFDVLIVFILFILDYYNVKLKRGGLSRSVTKQRLILISDNVLKKIHKPSMDGLCVYFLKDAFIVKYQHMNAIMLFKNTKKQFSSEWWFITILFDIKILRQKGFCILDLTLESEF